MINKFQKFLYIIRFLIIQEFFYIGKNNFQLSFFFFFSIHNNLVYDRFISDF